MKPAVHRILRILSDGVPRNISTLQHEGGPTRSTSYLHLPNMERQGLISSFPSGPQKLYAITEEGREAIEASSRAEFTKAFPTGLILASFPERGVVDFVHSEGLLRARRTPAGWDVREATGYTLTVDSDEAPLATLPPTVPLDRVAVEFGKGGAS